MAKKNSSKGILDKEVKKLKAKYGENFAIHFLPDPFLQIPLSNTEIASTADTIAVSLKKSEAGELSQIKSL